MIVGLTVVAFGTSAPELVVSITSAVKDLGDVSLGNVVGSNIFNVLAILGLTAIVRPLPIKGKSYARDIFLMLLSYIILLLMAVNYGALPLFRLGAIGRLDGVILLILFSAFLVYLVTLARKALPEEKLEDAPQKLGGSWLIDLLKLIGGLAALIYGGQLFIDNATEIAQALGMSDAFIGLTIVALGTSLPELATSITAALKGETEIAVGNVVGSCIFNTLLVVGASAAIQPIQVAGIGLLDMGIMLFSGILLLFLALWGGEKQDNQMIKTISRPEGAILFMVFLVYYAIIIIQQL